MLYILSLLKFIILKNRIEKELEVSKTYSQSIKSITANNLLITIFYDIVVH